MAFALTVDIVDPDGTIKVSHTFWGETEEEVETYHQEHAGNCEYFSAAVKEGRTVETIEEIDDDELPEPPAEGYEEEEEEAEEEGT